MTPSLSRITRELLYAFGRYPRKNLGQHFLTDPGVLQRILSAAELGKDDLVVEIGSGMGVVTAEIAKQVFHVIAIEIDSELSKISQDVLAVHDNISFVPKDILKTEMKELTLGRSYKIIGNLPYYITSPILEKILEAEDKPELAVLMMQKEVAQRIAAPPGIKTYGSLSVFVQFYAEVKLHSLVARGSFFPPPEVSSAIVVIKPYQESPFKVKDEKLFFDIVHAAFQQRRKKIRNSLEKYDLQGVDIDLNRRPETLSVAEFVKIANSLV